MTVEDLLYTALVGKYIKDYQCLYYITECREGSLSGIKIDPEHLINPIDMEWVDIGNSISLEAEVISKSEFTSELEYAFKQIKNNIENEYFEK